MSWKSSKMDVDKLNTAQPLNHKLHPQPRRMAMVSVAGVFTAEQIKAIVAELS